MHKTIWKHFNVTFAEDIFRTMFPCITLTCSFHSHNISHFRPSTTPTLFAILTCNLTLRCSPSFVTCLRPKLSASARPHWRVPDRCIRSFWRSHPPSSIPNCPDYAHWAADFEKLQLRIDHAASTGVPPSAATFAPTWPLETVESGLSMSCNRHQFLQHRRSAC